MINIKRTLYSTIITLLSQCSIWYLIEIPFGPSVYTPLYIMYEDTLSTFLNKLSVYCLYLLLPFLHHVWKHIAHISHQVITVCFLFSVIYLSTSCVKTLWLLYCLFCFKSISTSCIKTHCHICYQVITVVPSSTIIFQKL